MTARTPGPGRVARTAPHRVGADGDPSSARIPARSRRPFGRRSTGYRFLAPLALLLAGCGNGPDYPADWPALPSPKIKLSGTPCPDLSGTYRLPGAMKARVEKGRDRVVRFNTFLTAVSRRAHSTVDPATMVLEGPSEQGLKVAFYDRKDALIAERTLVVGVDFLCRGAWISDAHPSHTRSQPPQFYAKDIDGRLVGHNAYSGSGILLILGILPMPVIVADRAWWRIEPASSAS